MHPGWSEVRFEDAANMATGMGSGGSGDPARDIFDGGLDNYAAWYEAKSEQEKIQAVLATARPYPWGARKSGPLPRSGHVHAGRRDGPILEVQAGR